jgi:hypothetical protein
MVEQSGLDDSTRRLRPLCAICGQQVVSITSRTKRSILPVCHDAHCRIVADKQHTIPQDQFQGYLMHQSDLLRLRRINLKRSEQLKQEKRNAEAAEKDVWWSHLKELEAVQHIECPLTVTIPSGPSGSVTVSAERKVAFIAHLNSIIDQAGAPPATIPASEETHTLPMLSDHLARSLCTMCRGGCCAVGSDTALLTTATIRRIQVEHPETNATALVEQYLNLLPEQSMTDSCIFHTVDGCALPRSMRSDACNDYFCQPLVALPARLAEKSSSESAVIVLQRRQNDRGQNIVGLENDIIAAALISEAGIQTLPSLPTLETTNNSP